MEKILMIVPFLGVIALAFAAMLTAKVNKQEPGTDRMKEIAAAISEGAQAFLTAEYKILLIFVVVLFILIGVGIGNWITAICFVVGALFSTLAGYFGMSVATRANVRTANAAKQSGMNKALSIAFSGGAVMGMCVAGLGVLGVSAIYLITGNVDVLSGFSLGASSIALFARVGGGIYTKAADVGADLVGKVEAGIPEDDPRNPAVIADNVGDNVGDVAGMGADLFESYVGALISALTLGIVYYQVEGAVYPLIIAGLGLIASILGTFFVKGDENSNPILVPYGFRIIPLIKILQLDAVVYQRCVGTPSRKGVLSVHGAGKDGPVQAPEDVTLIPRISKRNDPRAPARQIGFLPQLHGIELVTVENHLFPPALELDSVGKQLRIMKVIKVCVYGQCRLIHFAGKGGHPGKPPAGGLSHTDDPDTGVLPALSPLHQKNLVTGLCQRDALLLKNTRVSRLMGTGHMAYFDHS